MKHTPDDSENTRPFAQFRNGVWSRINDTVSEEITLAISWQDRCTDQDGTTTLRAWPHELEALAAGHVLVDCLRPEGTPPSCPQRRATVEQTDAYAYRVTLGPADGAPLPPAPARLDAPLLLRAMHGFIKAPGMWDGTGCFHRTGVFDPTSETLLYRAEDIGRHNCLDRLAGWSLLTGTPLTDKVQLASARLTASMTAKALRAGFRVLVSRSAVTSAALALTEEAGATLMGFARTDEGRFTLFTDTPGRFTLPAEGA